MKYALTITILFVLVAKPKSGLSQANNNNQQEAIALITKLKNTYASFRGMSMGMQYYYANESTPNKYIDSLKGMLWLNGNTYRMVLDKTEMLVNEKYSICVFEEDKLIYLNKPSVSATTYNPVSVIDSLLSPRIGGVAKIEKSGNRIVLKIDMPSGGEWKSLSFTVDTITGFLISCKMIVKTSMMATGMDIATLKEEGYDTYAIVEASYNNYKQEILPVEYFSENTFITKQGKIFIATKKYEGYQVFLGTITL